MYNIAPLMFKVLCILSLLYVTSTAQFFGGGFPFPRDENDHSLKHTQGGLPSFSPRFKNFGFGKPDNLEKPKEKENNPKDIFNNEVKDRIKEKVNEEENKVDYEKVVKKINPKSKLGMPTFSLPKFPVPDFFPIPTFGFGMEVAPTDYQGKWEIVTLNSGVSAMHLQLMPTNKFAMFDATSLGKSSIELPRDRCRLVPNTTNVYDCFAHAVEYDPVSNNVRTLKVETNPWCSSGGLSAGGTLINTGGWEEGEKIIRHYRSCDTCDWKELYDTLVDNRWYASQAMLADGRFVVIGGRRAFNYEILTPNGQPVGQRYDFPFLFETTDLHENNLYPFLHLAPDGNLFILANNKAILLDVRNNKIIRKYPDLQGGARNYPGSGTTAILPINLNNNREDIDIEVLVCGGGQPLAFGKADKEGIFLPALDTCGKIKVLNPDSIWEMDKMPAARVMSDMLNLPNGEIILINGAKKGSSGWQFADEPNLTPYLYSPNKPIGQRFRVLAPSQIARMYHSSSAVLPDGKILVAGSNTNAGYLFANVKFPTELRVEKFSPPYLDPKLQKLAPRDIILDIKPNVFYNQLIIFQCTIDEPEPQPNKPRRGIMSEDVTVTLYKPPFTTHGYSMDQRILLLKLIFFAPFGSQFTVKAQAPPRPEVAPPGYYLLFINHHGVPSPGTWIQLQ